MRNENLAALQPRLSSIDCLRGGAALAVVVHHALEMRNEPAHAPAWFHIIRTVLYQGYLGVPLFFVISGFCIHLRCAKALSRGQEPALGFISFWKRRIHRLYPPYFVVLCLSMATVLTGYFLHMHGATANYPNPKLRWMGFDFLAHVFMLHGFIPRFDMGAGNPPFWTLAREEYLYLLYFFVFAWRKRLGIYPALGLVLFCGLAFNLVFLPFVRPGSEWWLVTSTSAIVLWIQWCLGMLAVEAYYGVVKLPGWMSQLRAAGLMGGLAKMAELYLPLLAPLLWGITFFVLVNYCANKESQRVFPASKITRWLAGVGLFSYSLYLVHFPVERVLIGFFRSQATMAGYAFSTVLLTVVSYYAGKFFFLLVEKKFLNAKPRLLTGIPSKLAEAGTGDSVGQTKPGSL